MKLQDAFMILDNNYNCKKNSFIYELHEHCKFDNILFWQYYDCIICIAKNQKTKKESKEISLRITCSYQAILRLIIANLDNNDFYKIKNFPKNYNDYLERLDYAIKEAYFKQVFIDENLFELQK